MYAQSQLKRIEGRPVFTSRKYKDPRENHDRRLHHLILRWVSGEGPRYKFRPPPLNARDSVDRLVLCLE